MNVETLLYSAIVIGAAALILTAKLAYNNYKRTKSLKIPLQSYKQLSLDYTALKIELSKMQLDNKGMDKLKSNLKEIIFSLRAIRKEIELLEDPKTQKAGKNGSHNLDALEYRLHEAINADSTAREKSE